jgi:hypothetical protein
MYTWLAWLIIMGFGLDDWIYWHFFTITVNYNSSHIELLPNAVWRISHYSRTDLSCLWIEPESYVTTDGQSASLSSNKEPIWGLRPDFYYCQTVAGLLMWDALSDERMGLLFTTAAGLRQRSHSRVRVPWNSRPYFSVSDSRLTSSSRPTTRRVTVEVFDPASTRDCPWIQVKVTLRLTVSQSVSLGVEPHVRPMTRY